MDALKTAVFCFCLAFMFLTIQAKECKNDKYDNHVSYRVLLLKSEGSRPKRNATKSDFVKEYGQCDADQHAMKMVDYFESYGLDMSDVREDPFRYHSLDQYELGLSSSVNYRLVMTSLFDYTSFENSHTYSAWWGVTIKEDVNGPNGNRLQGSRLWFGMYRIKIHNRDFCLYYTSDVPAMSNSEDLVPVDLIVESPEWGHGTGRGLVKVSQLAATEVYTFPGKNTRFKA